MDEIEKGFSALVKELKELQSEKEEIPDEIRERGSTLLQRMAKSASPIIKTIGLNLLEKGKAGASGEIYDSLFYTKKMIVLGKTEPEKYRPDDINKKVDTQLCALSEDGEFFEVMYSSDGFIIDSYLNPLSTTEALDIYGNEITFMLYRALRDYLVEERDLVDALGKTLEYIYSEE